MIRNLLIQGEEAFGFAFLGISSLSHSYKALKFVGAFQEGKDATMKSMCCLQHFVPLVPLLSVS